MPLKEGMTEGLRDLNEGAECERMCHMTHGNFATDAFGIDVGLRCKCVLEKRPPW